MAKKVQQVFVKSKPHCILVLLDMLIMVKQL